MTERTGDEGSKRTEVTMIWGIRWSLWSFVMASMRSDVDVILTSDSNLNNHRHPSYTNQGLCVLSLELVREDQIGIAQ